MTKRRPSGRASRQRRAGQLVEMPVVATAANLETAGHSGRKRLNAPSGLAVDWAWFVYMGSNRRKRGKPATMESKMARGSMYA